MSIPFASKLAKIRGPKPGASHENGATVVGFALNWPKSGSSSFRGCFGPLDVRWQASCFSNIVIYRDRPIHPIWKSCRGAGCRNPDLWLSVWADFGTTFGQQPPVGHHNLSYENCSRFWPSALVRLHASLKVTKRSDPIRP